MNPTIDKVLEKATDVLNKPAKQTPYKGPVHVGVDLGTAYTVLVVWDENFMPLAGRYQFAQIVKDGLIVDFLGAIQLLKTMKADVEAELGFALTSAATSFPPGVPLAEVKATQNVLIASGLECSNFIDEPTAANALLGIENGAIVDVGGGTTGIAIVKNGKVVYTADEATGGTQFSLVLAGAMNMAFEEAETFKKDPANQQMVYSLVRPVMEKVGTIVQRHIAGQDVEAIHLVGGTGGMMGLREIIAEMTGLKTFVPSAPLFVTPIGIAMNDKVS